MKKPNWFQRTTGSPVKIAFSDCGCRYHNRPYCFDCKADENYEEQPPRLSNNTITPSWKKRWNKVMLTPADARFLAGIPETKPFYRKRRQQWQRAY